MSRSFYRPEAWPGIDGDRSKGYIINASNVTYDSRFTIPIRNERHRSFRPIAVINKNGNIGVSRINNDNEFELGPLNDLPGISSLAPKHLPGLNLLVMQAVIRPGKQSSAKLDSEGRERFVRLFAAPPRLTEDGIPPAHFAIGQPQMYPDEEGLFMGAVCIGVMPLSKYEPIYLEPIMRRLMYFPILTESIELIPPW